MALPWFSFYTDDYLGNTMHLTTEEHGAYLLLMLAYYRTEKPLPGHDRALAGTVRLPIDRWLIARVALEPFFKVEGDVWRHERIEAEIAERQAKHAMSSEKARNAALAKAEKYRSKHAPSKPEAAPKPARTKREPSSSPTHLHLQLQTTLSNERVVAPEAPKHDDDPKAVEEIGREEPLNPLGTTLPETWTPDAACQATAEAYGMLPADIEAEVLTFHAYNAQNGTFSKNWSATWQMWCARWKERKPKLPLPRVEVDHTPSDADWNRACTRWAKDGSTWSYKSLGPEPGQARCRCPTAILAKHNIDPETGRAATPSKEPVS